MTELVEWLNRCLDEDEAVARACSEQDVAERWHWVWTGGPQGRPDDGVTDTPVDLDDPDLKDGVLVKDPDWSPAGLRSVEEYPTDHDWTLPTFVLGGIDEVPITSARHIVRHDPASVLADIAAKRRIIEIHPHAVADAGDCDPGGPTFGCQPCHWSDVYECQLGFGWCDTVRALASAYRHRPGYDPAWAPT